MTNILTFLIPAAFRQEFGLDYAFMQRALAAALLVGALCPVLGVFVVVRRLAFFGDAIAHSAFAGIALGLIVGVDPGFTSIIFAVAIAAVLGLMQSRTGLPSDTIIGVTFAGVAALGVLLIGMLQGYQASFFGYLFGDILAASWTDICVMAVVLGVVAVIVLKLRRPLLQVAVNREVAAAQGVPVNALEYALFIMLAITVAVSIRVIGNILVSAMLIVPAAAARNVSFSLKSMFGWAITFGTLSGIVGLLISYQLNARTGPMMVLVAVLIFGITSIFKRDQ